MSLISNPKSKIQNPKLKIPFTLIELVVVMGIMAMLIGIALPAFTKLAKGSGASLASRTLVGKLGLTRGYAINARQYAALLFYQADVPSVGGDTPEGPTAKTKYFNKAYRICYVAKDSSAPPNYYFQRWVQGENWDYAPAGVAVLEVNDQSTVFSMTLPDNTAGLGGVNHFTPIYFTSACLADNYVPGIIFAPTGKPVPVGDRYVKIGEGTYSGTALTVTNRNPNAYVSLKVDQFTGRITFGTD